VATELVCPVGVQLNVYGPGIFIGVAVAVPRPLQFIEEVVIARFETGILIVMVDTQPSPNEAVALTGPLMLYEARVLLLVTERGGGDHTTDIGVPDAPKLVKEAVARLPMHPGIGVRTGTGLGETQIILVVTELVIEAQLLTDARKQIFAFSGEVMNVGEVAPLMLFQGPIVFAHDCHCIFPE
jgi:hypothetical protein